MNDTIRYWIYDTTQYPLYYRADGTTKGLWADFIGELALETGATCSPAVNESGEALTAADALDMLEEGELDLVLGLPAGLDIQAHSAPVYENALTALILENSPQAGRLVENCYWGIDSAVISLTQNTILDGHVLDFNNERELFEALDNKDVYGILVKRSLLDYNAWFGKTGRYREFEGLKLPYTDCVYYKADDPGLEETVRTVAEKIRNSYSSIPDYTKETHTELVAADNLAAYYNLLAGADQKLGFFSVLAVAGCFLAVSFGVIAAALASKLGSERRLEAAKLATLFDGEPDKELFELNLISKKLYAYKDFEIFGVTKKSLPNPVKLEKLSNIMGFDFAGHFHDVPLHGNTIYKNRFIIHAGGRKLFIAENGRRIGSTLLVTMALVKEEHD
ncbi:MAG: hypothetical protein K6G81_11030 [Lachnospiraceae bacterium]|nr:hypothetical protein [Lachnospiraceae bacterium]